MHLVCCYYVLLMLLLLACTLPYSIGLLLIYFSMFSNGSVHIFKCFVLWYWKYVSTVTDVGLMCHLLCVILLPFVVSCIVYVSHGGCGLLCPLPSHESMVCHLLTGPLQLTLWGVMQTLVNHHCYFYIVCVLVYYDACHQ